MEDLEQIGPEMNPPAFKTQSKQLMLEKSSEQEKKNDKNIENLKEIDFEQVNIPK